MNREIMFRGKRFDNGEWMYGIPLFDWAPCSLKCKNQHNGELLTFFGWNDGCHEYDEFEVDPATVGQYTGQTDKNGVKIFEGDILSRDCYDKSGRIVKIVYSEELAEFCAQTPSGFGFSMLPPNGKVMGNIHDNQELLGGNYETTYN